MTNSEHMGKGWASVKRPALNGGKRFLSPRLGVLASMQHKHSMQRAGKRRPPANVSLRLASRSLLCTAFVLETRAAFSVCFVSKLVDFSFPARFHACLGKCVFRFLFLCFVSILVSIDCASFPVSCLKV